VVDNHEPATSCQDAKQATTDDGLSIAIGHCLAKNSSEGEIVASRGIEVGQATRLGRSKGVV